MSLLYERLIQKNEVNMKLSNVLLLASVNYIEQFRTAVAVVAFGKQPDAHQYDSREHKPRDTPRHRRRSPKVRHLAA